MTLAGANSPRRSIESIRSLVKVAMPHSLGANVPRKAMYSSFDSGIPGFTNNSHVTLLGFWRNKNIGNFCLKTPSPINNSFRHLKNLRAYIQQDKRDS